jgi:S1-C subfamily serine protease
MKWLKDFRLWFVVFIVALCVGTAVYWPAPFDPVASAVLIYNDSGHGSGVIIGPHAILTAGHVADQVGLIVRCANGAEYPVESNLRVSDADVAILFVTEILPYHPIIYASSDGKSGDPLVGIGAPFDPNLVGCVLQGYTVKSDVKTSMWPVADICDIHSEPGCSGGPVFYNNKLIGIIVGSCDNLSIFVPISICRKVLEPCRR